MSEKEIISTEENKPEADVKAVDPVVAPKNNENVSAASNTVSPTAQVAPKQDSNPTPVIIKQSSKGWSFMAILLSLIALAGSGFLYVEGKNELKLANLNVEKNSNLAAVGDSENARLLQQSLAEQQKIINQFATIDENIKLINQRYDNTEKAYKSLTTGRLQWLIDETEYTLNIASQQLMFSGDIHSTLKTLEVVEKRLNRFNQAQLLPLKKAISEDYQLIKQQSYVDVVSASLRIDRLNSVIDTLPLFADSMLVPAESTNTVIPAKKNLTWYENLWESIKSSSVNLVQVRKIENADAMLISPEQAYFLRQNIKLRFLSARIALLQHQQGIYSSELNQIKQTVNQYFDQQNDRTKVLLSEIDELLQLKLALPDGNNLKNSLAAILAIRGEFSNIDEIDEIGKLALEQTLADGTTETAPVADSAINEESNATAETNAAAETNPENVTATPPVANMPVDGQTVKGDNQ